MNDSSLTFGAVLLAILVSALTGFATYFANYKATKKNSDEQLKENRIGLVTTLLNDMRSLHSLYEQGIRHSLLQTIQENQIPNISLAGTGQNYFAVFDNLISELRIINHPVQQVVMRFYIIAKAQYDQSLDYSQKLEQFLSFRSETGFTLLGIPEDIISKLTEQDFQKMSVINPTMAARLDYYKRTETMLFNRLKDYYQVLMQTDAELSKLYQNVPQDLEGYLQSLKST